MGNICPYCMCQFCQSCGMSQAGKMSAANRCAKCGKGVFDSPGSDGRSGSQGGKGTHVVAQPPMLHNAWWETLIATVCVLLCVSVCGCLVLAGMDGRDGNAGRSGNSGREGRAGNAGVALYAIPGMQSATNYTIHLEAMHVIDDDGDGIFSPGSLVYIDGITVGNPGGLPLPPGSVCLPVAESFGTVEEGVPLPIPALPIGGQAAVPGRFAIRLGPMGQPSGDPFVTEATFSVGSSMLNRMFGTGYLGSSVTVQWPVRLGAIRGPPSVGYDYPVGPGQTLEFVVEIVNISKKPVLPEEVLLSLDVSGTQLTLAAATTGIAAPLPPESTGEMKFLVTANKDALLFSRHAWRACLVYRGQPIQTASRRLKVSAKYEPPVGAPSDVLFFVGPQIDLPEFTAWSRIFSAFNLSVDLWDVDGNFGVSVDARTGGACLGARCLCAWLLSLRSFSHFLVVTAFPVLVLQPATRSPGMVATKVVSWCSPLTRTSLGDSFTPLTSSHTSSPTSTRLVAKLLLLLAVQAVVC